MVMGSFVDELKRLRDSLVTMGNEVADMVGVAVKALSDGDEEQARVVIARDKTINAM